MLVVEAVVDPTGVPGDERVASEAEVWVYAVNGFYDALVAHGFTNSYGCFAVRLIAGREYVVLVKKAGIDNVYARAVSVYLEPGMESKVLRIVLYNEG